MKTCTVWGIIFAFKWSKGELWWTLDGEEKRSYLLDVSIIQQGRRRALQVILLNLWIGVAKK